MGQGIGGVFFQGKLEQADGRVDVLRLLVADQEGTAFEVGIISTRVGGAADGKNAAGLRCQIDLQDLSQPRDDLLLHRRGLARRLGDGDGAELADRFRVDQRQVEDDPAVGGSARSRSLKAS